MRKVLTAILLAAAATLAAAADARACSCIANVAQRQPCGASAAADVIFAGTVAEVGPPVAVAGSDGKVFTTNGQVTRFRVDEAFRGVAGDAAETHGRGTSCDYHFRAGERYFVYGSRDPADGKVYVHSCSMTKELQNAEADLAYARGRLRGEPTPSIVGFVSRETRESAASYRSHKPLDGVEIEIEGGGRSFKGTTDGAGMFRVFGLPAGLYKVRAKTPRTLRTLYGPDTFELQVAEGRCAGAGFTVTSLSTVGGRVVDHLGKIVKTKVSLVPLDEEGREVPPAEGNVETHTDAAGRYKFDWVAPGRYRVAVNPQSQPDTYDPPYPRTYLPGVREAARATVISVADGVAAEAEEFRLPPPLEEIFVEGVVLLPDGTPAAGALVLLEFTERDWSESFSADAQGRFRLKAFKGYSYLVSGELRKEVNGKWTGTHSEAAEVTAGEAGEPVKLVITRPGFYRPRYAQKPREKHR